MLSLRFQMDQTAFFFFCRGIIRFEVRLKMIDLWGPFCILCSAFDVRLKVMDL